MKYASNRYSDIRRQLISDLKGLYDEREISQMIFMLYEAFAGITRSELAMDRHKTVSESELLKIHFAVKDLKRQRPIQYILGKTSFYGLELKVNEDVLIPRPETEGLVALLLEDLQGQVHEAMLRIIDIGTGSGCIALALKNNQREARIFAVDFNEKAISLARHNAQLLNQEIDLRFMDLEKEKTWPQGEQFDVIVSNPPYVCESDKIGMKPNVLNYEPPESLFVPDAHALKFYSMIIGFSARHLTPGGLVYVEINERLGKDTGQLFKSGGFSDVELKKDLQGKDRYVRARKSL